MPDNVIEHQDVKLRCSLSSTQGETIQYNWTNGQGTLIVRNSLSGDLTLEGIERTEAGPYTCTAGNVAGATQKSVTLNVLCESLIQPVHSIYLCLPKCLLVFEDNCLMSSILSLLFR